MSTIGWEFRYGLVVVAVGLLTAGCSTGTKRVASSTTVKTTVTATTPTTQATTTSSEATTTTTVNSPNLQDHMIAPPAGYTFAESLGDTTNANLPGGTSGDITASDLNGGLGVPTAATTLHFKLGYDQWYHYDASPPNSTVRALELDLFEFDSATDCAAFVQQAATRAGHLMIRASKAATTVSGAPAITVTDAVKAPDGTYIHALLASNGDRAMELWYGDVAPAPSAFLASVAVQQYAKLQTSTS
jgi:hypothetical protein